MSKQYLFRPLSFVKSLVVPSSSSVRTIKTGAFRGLRMILDLQSQSQIYLGLAEREVYSWLKKISIDVRTAIDIGAAQGEYALYFLAKTSACRVFVFDANRQENELFCKNLALNGFSMGERVLAITTYVSENAFALDQLQSLIVPPCCVKIDVDGGEVSVLKSAPHLLKMPQMRWLIETHSAELEKECRELLTAYGYQTIVIPNAFWRIIIPELRNSPHNRWLIAVRDELPVNSMHA